VKVIWYLLIAICAAAPATARAQETIRVLYVNGIQNTLPQADKAREEIEKILIDSENHQFNKRTFKVELVYNQTGSGSGDPEWLVCELCQELRELFIQKTAEERFAQHLRKIIIPFNAPLTVVDPSAADYIKQNFLFDPTPGGNSLESSGLVTDAAMAQSQEVALRLLQNMRRSKSIVVAHSQGNLLANLAYAALVSEKGQAASQWVRVINLANTSKFAVSGLNLTHANDSALYDVSAVHNSGLEHLPAKQNWSRDDAPCGSPTCDFQLSTATLSGVSFTSTFNHRVVETYLSDIDVSLIDNQWVPTSGRGRFRDHFEDFVYAAAASLPEGTPPPPSSNECSFAFSDTFDGTGPVASAWAPANSNVNGTLVREGGKLTVTTTDGHAGIYRAMDTSYTATMSARITEKNGVGGALRSYGTWLLFRQNSTRDRGYGVVFRRTDATVSDSSVELVRNGTILERLRTPFEYGSYIDVKVSIAPDGGVRGILKNSDGQQYTFSFTPRALPPGGSDLLIDQELPSGNSPSIKYPTIDDFAFAYGEGCLNERLVYAQSFLTDPRWDTDRPDLFKWIVGSSTFSSRTFSGVPTYSPNRYATIKLPAFDPNRGFRLEWDQRVTAVEGNAQVHFGLYSDDLLSHSATYIGLPFLNAKSTLNFASGYSTQYGFGFYQFNIIGEAGTNSGQGGSGASIAPIGTWQRFRISYNPVNRVAQIQIIDKATGAVSFFLENAVPQAFSFAPSMQYLGIANHPTGYHPGLIWALTPNGYLDTEFDNVVLTYEAPLTFFPTISVSPVVVPIGGSTTVSWSSGAAPISLCSMARGSAPLPPLTTPTASYTASNIQGRTTFTLTCGSSSATATVEVIPVVGGG